MPFANDLLKQVAESADADERRARRPVLAYPNDTLPRADMNMLAAASASASPIEVIRIPPRDAKAFRVPGGHLFRITSIQGPQVGDLNLWNAHDLTERFFSGKTRALHATHVTTGDRLWSNLPYLRPLATITQDTLSWYGIDADGGSVHDVVGTRCDPYTHRLLSGGTYHYCCHSNLARGLGEYLGKPPREVEHHVHDVLNVFMCTGFTRDSKRYFMKASPVRPGDFIEFFAEIDLLGALSACPGGDCSAIHSSDDAACYPLQVDILKPAPATIAGWKPASLSDYDRSHGTSNPDVSVSFPSA